MAEVERELVAFVSARLDDKQLFAEAALEGWPDEFVGAVVRADSQPHGAHELDIGTRAVQGGQGHPPA